jgi:fucose permease
VIPDHRIGLPQFSLKALLLAIAFVAVGTLIGKWLLLNVAAQLMLALLSAIALLLLAGYWIGSGIGYAYGNSQRGGMTGAAIMLFFIVIVGFLIVPHP